MIRGYHADVDHEVAGYRLYRLVVRTAPVPEREELAAAAAAGAGVVEAREVMAGEANVLVRTVGADGDDSRASARNWTNSACASPTGVRSDTHRRPYARFDDSDAD